MSDIATLGIRIDARQVRDADNALDRLANTGGRTERAVDGVNSAFERMQRLAASVGAALGVAEIIKQADAWANLQGQLSLVADGQERLAQTTDALFQMAQRTRQQLQATVDLYAKVTRSTESLNKTDAERLRVTETINKTLAISHASTEASAAALLQLGQAFSANRLGGEELNSILEQTPALARAIAEGMGKTMGDLKAMGATGKLTGEVVFSSLQRMGASVDAEFGKLPTTVAQAMTQVQNAILRTIGVFDQQNQLSSGLARGLTTLSENMTVVAGAAATLAAVKLVTWLADVNMGIRQNIAASAAQRAAIVASYEADATATAIASLNAETTRREAIAHLNAATSTEAHAFANGQLIAAEAAVTATTNAHTVAMERLTIAQRMYSTMSTATSAALAAVGGPLGLIVTVLGVAATAWTWYQQKEEEANRKAAEDTGKSTGEILAHLDKQIEKMRERAVLMKQAGKDAPIVTQGGDAGERAAELLTRINALKEQGNALDAGSQVELITLTGMYDQLVGKAKTLASVTAGVTAQTNADKVKDWLAKHTEYLDKAGKIAAAIAEAKKDLGDAFNSDIENKIRASFAKADVDKAKNAYQELIAGINEKIGANKIEIAVGRNATEAQKEQIKFDQELASGKLKLSATQRKGVQAALDMLTVTEKQAKAAQVVKDLAKADAEAQLAQQEAAAGLAVYVDNYGKLTDARDLDMIAVKNQYELQRKLLDATAQGIVYTDEQIEKIRVDTDVRTKNEQAITAQLKALQYAEQLRQENQRFSVDYTVDPKAKAAAQLAIDKSLWEQRIALAAEGTEARKRLESEYSTWLQNQTIKPQLDAQIAMWDSIEQAARDAFVGMLSNGKSTFERLRDSLKNTLFALLYEMTLKKWIVQVEAQMVGSTMGGVGGTSGGSALGSIASMIATGKSIYTGFQSGVMSSLGGAVTTMGGMFGSEAAAAFGTGLSLTTEQAATAASAYSAAGNTAVAGGLTSGASAAPMLSYAGWIGAGMAVANSLYSKGWDPNNGSINASGKYAPIAGESLLMNKAFKAIGLSDSMANLFSGASLVSAVFGRKSPEITSQGVRGTYSDGQVVGESYQNIFEKGGLLRGDKRYTNTQALDAAGQSQISQSFAAIIDASTVMAKTLDLGADSLNKYSKSFDIALDPLKEVKGSAAEQAAIVAENAKINAKNQAELEKFFTGVSNDIAKLLVPNLDAFSRTGETASDTLKRLSDEFVSTTTAAQNLGKTAMEMFGSAGMDSAATRDRLVQLAGGGSALTSLTSSFAQQYLSDAERLAPVSKALAEALGELGLDSVPTTTAQFKELVQSLDPADAASARLLVSLLQLSDAFYRVHDAADKAARDNAYSALQRAVNAQKDLVEEAFGATMKQLDKAIDKTKTSVTALKSLSDALHEAVGKAGTEDMRREEGQAKIRAALAIAKAGGPLPSADSLKDALGAVTQDSKNIFSSFEDYQRDRLQTAIDLSNLASVTDDQLSTADRQLAVLEATKEAAQAAYDAEVARLDNVLETAQRQLDAINGVDVSVKSVEQAIAAFMALVGGNSNAGIVGAYGNALGRAPDAAGMAYWQNAIANGATVSDVTKAIGASAEAAAKIETLYRNIFDRSADNAGLQYWQSQLSAGVSLGSIEAAMRASDEARAKLASTTTNSASTTGTIASSTAVSDAALTQALTRIASYTQRTAIAAEDANRNAMETT